MLLHQPNACLPAVPPRGQQVAARLKGALAETRRVAPLQIGERFAQRLAGQKVARLFGQLLRAKCCTADGIS